MALVVVVPASRTLHSLCSLVSVLVLYGFYIASLVQALITQKPIHLHVTQQRYAKTQIGGKHIVSCLIVVIPLLCLKLP